MNPPVLLDTGPLVAFLKAQDNFHHWAADQLDRISFPLITCEPVITVAGGCLPGSPR